MCEQEPKNKVTYEESFESIRNNILQPFIGQGIYDDEPPNWIYLLKYYGNNYRSKMAKALISRVGHDGD